MELEKARAGQWPAVLVQSPASLRSTPLDLRDAEWLEAAARLGFPVDDGVDSGCFVNAYESLGAEIVIDHATGLEWQKRPSKSMSFAEVDAYVVRFNEAIGANLAWRLPTNEELASLIDWAVYSDGTRVDSWVFETPSDLYWSADYRIADGERHQWALDVRSAILSFAWPEDRSKKRVRLVRNATEQDDG